MVMRLMPVIQGVSAVDSEVSTTGSIATTLGAEDRVRQNEAIPINALDSNATETDIGGTRGQGYKLVGGFVGGYTVCEGGEESGGSLHRGVIGIDLAHKGETKHKTTSV
jgi:hypothetical protein